MNESGKTLPLFRDAIRSLLVLLDDDGSSDVPDAAARRPTEDRGITRLEECRTCIYRGASDGLFRPLKGLSDVPFRDGPLLCQRRAPVRTPETGEAQWPIITLSAWCGDWESEDGES